LGGRLAAELRNRTIRHLRLVLPLAVGLVIMMTIELQASTGQPARASVLVDRVSWNPVPPAGVSGTEPRGCRTFVDNILDAHDRWQVPRAIPGADGCKSLQLVRLRTTY
jgi:hypothetical protein